MTKFFKEHFTHFVLYVLEVAFAYLHKSYDICYDLDCEKFQISCKEGVKKDA